MGMVSEFLFSSHPDMKVDVAGLSECCRYFEMEDEPRTLDALGRRLSGKLWGYLTSEVRSELTLLGQVVVNSSPEKYVELHFLYEEGYPFRLVFTPDSARLDILEDKEPFFKKLIWSYLLIDPDYGFEERSFVEQFNLRKYRRCVDDGSIRYTRSIVL